MRNVIFIAALAVGSFVLTCSAATPPRRMRTPGSLTTRIVGGSMISIEQAPYQLSVELYGAHACGACVLSAQWALTAAHCADRANNDTDNIQLRAGSSFYGREGTVHSVGLIVIQPDFDDYSYYQDVALLKVLEPFSLGATIATISLASVEPPVGAVCTLTGWGRTHAEYPDIPERLRQVQLPVIELPRCDLLYQVYDGVSNTSLCAGPESGGMDACEGDFGGPLVLDATLVGVASWGKGCGQRGYPAVFTSIALVRDWILSVAPLSAVSFDSSS